jgi:hypothetical protein
MVAPGVREVAPSPSGRGATRFLVAAYVSYYGDWLTTTALLVVLYRLTNSAAAPAGYIVARVAPRVIGAGYAGSLGERFSPTRLIAAAWVAQGALTLSIVPLVAARALPGIYAAVVASQFLNAIARPSIGTAIPRVVGPGQVARFNGLLSGADNSSMLVAPAVGALLLQFSGPSLLLLLDAISFGVAAFLIAGLAAGSASRPGADEGRRRSFSGLRILLNDRVLRLVAATFFAGTLTVAATQSVLEAAAAQRFGGDTVVGWLFSAVGAGAVAATIVLVKRQTRITRPTLSLAAFASIAPLAILTLAHQLWFALLLLAVSSAASVFMETWGSIDIQQRVPAADLARVNAAVFVIFYSGMLVGAVSGLVLSALIHWDRALAMICGLAALVIVAGLSRASHREPAVTPLTEIPD